MEERGGGSEEEAGKRAVRSGRHERLLHERLLHERLLHGGGSGQECRRATRLLTLPQPDTDPARVGAEHTCTSTFSKVVASSSALSTSFLPHTATICAPFGSDVPSSCAIASTCFPSEPMPSPPPTISTVLRSASSPSSLTSSSRERGACQKEGRTGRPYCRICSTPSPHRFATLRIAVEGMKHASQCLVNHHR